MASIAGQSNGLKDSVWKMAEDIQVADVVVTGFFCNVVGRTVWACGRARCRSRIYSA